MKKIIISLMTMILCLFLFALPLFSQEKGDVNNDLYIDIIDALLVSRYYVGLNPYNFNQDAADVDCNGTITMVDALLIAQYYVGLIPDFPGCSETPSPTPPPTNIPTVAPTQITTPVTTATFTEIPSPPPTLAGATSMPEITLHPTATTEYTPTVTPYPPVLTPIPTPIPTQDINENIEWQTMSGGNKGEIATSVQRTSDNGYIIAGYSNSTDLDGCIFRGEGSDCYVVKLDPEGIIQWQVMFGGNDTDCAFAIRVIPNNGYIVVGSSSSTDIEGCLNHGKEDGYIVKLNEQGLIEWQKMIGGSSYERLEAVEITPDNGFIFTGYSQSVDIEGCINHGNMDSYIIKLDANGNIEWEKMYGGNYGDTSTSIRKTPGNGYIICGYSSSTNIEGCTNHGSYDYHLIKINEEGIIEWQTMIGGHDLDIAASLAITTDNGFIIGGYSVSTDTGGCLNHGENDYYIVKSDSEGTVEWQRMLGGSADDYLTALDVTQDNGCVITGYSLSTDIRDCVNHGKADFYTAKLDMAGNIVWDEMIGGNGWDEPGGIQTISNKSCLIAGYSNSTDISGCPNNGTTEIYIVNLDVKESDEWQMKMIGGSGWDAARSIGTTSDNGYIIAGSSSSGDLEGCRHHGYGDYYIVKLDANENIEWQKMIGGNYVDNPTTMQITPDDGCIIAGYCESTDIEGCLYNGGESDAYIVKLDAQGNFEWNSMIGGTNEESINEIHLTPDNGYILAGYSGSTDIEGCINNGSIDCFLVKLDAEGIIEWKTMFGGSNGDRISSIDITSDNGYIVCGESNSTDIPGCINNGDYDCYIAKLDIQGTIEWQTMFGGTRSECSTSIREIEGNGYIIAGISDSTDIKGCINHGDYDLHIIKLDINGNIESQGMIGGNGCDFVYELQATSDMKYVIAGFSSSTDIEGCINRGNSDVYIIKIDETGECIWQTMIGGINSDEAAAICEISTNSYIAAGYSNSTDIAGCINHGYTDIFLVNIP
ncbi:MAG: dockerin type I repeat-containing protein [Spirochaetales bacterium]|nr:dockerin type I repeat-containing protein [Spirochaetales bacterium]